MDEVYINLKELYGFKYIKEYFDKKDLISVGEIVDALEYELGIANAKLLRESKWTEEEKREAYDWEMYEDKLLREGDEFNEN